MAEGILSSVLCYDNCKKVMVWKNTISPEFAATGITGGAAVIMGRFTGQQANDLSIKLKGGALPIPIKIKVITPNQ
jgi:preprotein translocase subunit SecD